MPLDVCFATKPKLAARMIARAMAASVPFKWVAGDTVHGVGDIEQQLRRRRLSAGAGTKGPRLHDWCYLELADLDAEEFNSADQGLWTRGLLIHRRIADGDLAFFTTWCPAATSIETLVAVEGHRLAIED